MRVKAGCMSNMKQIALGYNMYADDNNDHFQGICSPSSNC